MLTTHCNGGKTHIHEKREAVLIPNAQIHYATVWGGAHGPHGHAQGHRRHTGHYLLLLGSLSPLVPRRGHVCGREGCDAVLCVVVVLTGRRLDGRLRANHTLEGVWTARHRIMASRRAAQSTVWPHARHLVSAPCATCAPANPLLPKPRTRTSRRVVFVPRVVAAGLGSAGGDSAPLGGGSSAPSLEYEVTRDGTKRLHTVPWTLCACS